MHPGADSVGNTRVSRVVLHGIKGYLGFLQYLKQHYQLQGRRSQPKLDRYQSGYYQFSSFLPVMWLTQIYAEAYPTICTVEADTKSIARSLKPIHGVDGPYYVLNYDIVLTFGTTEMKAQVAWKEKVGIPCCIA